MTQDLQAAIRYANQCAIVYGMTYSVIDLTENWYGVVSGQCDISIYVTIQNCYQLDKF